MTTEANVITTCEVCGGSDLKPVLDLGNHPLCDDLVPVGESRRNVKYPINIVYCENCCTAHQKYQVPKRELFPQTYHYRSRFTADVLNGMRGLVERCKQAFGDMTGKTVLDIGCNDGSLLGFFRDQGAKTVGIEPTGAYVDAVAQGHPVYNDYFTPELAEKVVVEHGRPDFIVFTNVFAHIEDLSAVLEGLRRLMSDTTVIVIENHYLGSVLDGNQFDTFYHEHPRTYSFTSFSYIARSLGLDVAVTEFPARYGGNIRVILAPNSLGNVAMPAETQAVLDREADFGARFGAMNKDIAIWRERKRAELEALVVKHGKLNAKAFPGRAAILIELLGLDETIIARVHEKPGSMKIGHYLPGTRIPIVSDDVLFAESDLSKPLLNLAWHISTEIRSFMAERGYTGPIIDILSPSDFKDLE
ncbi:MAG: class I SAM-dependent methyltransferase [Kaiparowitsia implicata GSE-PSE-MK54-09C]|jgi:SAM-dependent methyltransferase|nr:class I SAM-dependent methyltransferase [Kaiparowitsia implicata GSE-PSE-MK54-09C]